VLHLVVPATSTGLLVERPGAFVARTLAAYAVLWSVLLGGAWLLRRLTRHPVWARRVVRWPLVGPPLRLAAQLRFLRALAALYGAGIRIDEALSEASAAVGPAPPTPEFSQAAAVARAGESIERALAVLLTLDPVARMELATASQSGSLEEALERVVLRLQESWEASLQRTARVTAGGLYVVAVIAAATAIISFWSGYFAQLTNRAAGDGGRSTLARDAEELTEPRALRRRRVVEQPPLLRGRELARDVAEDLALLLLAEVEEAARPAGRKRCSLLIQSRPASSMSPVRASSTSAANSGSPRSDVRSPSSFSHSVVGEAAADRLAQVVERLALAVLDRADAGEVVVRVLALPRAGEALDQVAVALLGRRVVVELLVVVPDVEESSRRNSA
jgi:hypothetical protein